MIASRYPLTYKHYSEYSWRTSKMGSRSIPVYTGHFFPAQYNSCWKTPGQWRYLPDRPPRKEPSHQKTSIPSVNTIRMKRTLTALSVVLRETTGQFSQVIKPLFKTDLWLRTLRTLIFGPNENTIIGKSSRVQTIERIIAQKKKEGGE